jgi:hypothetical protein
MTLVDPTRSIVAERVKHQVTKDVEFFEARSTCEAADE